MFMSQIHQSMTMSIFGQSDQKKKPLTSVVCPSFFFLQIWVNEPGSWIENSKYPTSNPNHQSSSAQHQNNNTKSNTKAQQAADFATFQSPTQGIRRRAFSSRRLFGSSYLITLYHTYACPVDRRPSCDGWWCVIWLCASSADDTSSSRSNNPKRIAFVHLDHGWLTMSLVQHRSSRDHGWSLSHSSPQAARRRLTTPDANNTAKTTIPCNLECCTLLSSSSLYKVGPYDTVSSVIYLPDSIDGNVDIQIVIGLLHLRCCTTRRPSLNNARGHCLLLISPGLPT